MAIRWYRTQTDRAARTTARTRTRSVLRGCLRSGCPRDRAALLVATVGGLGFLPKGSALAALVGGAAAALLSSSGWTWVGLAGATAVGIAATSRVHRACGVSDPIEISVDEVAGAWLAVAIAGVSGWACLAPVALFGAFDFLKPWPANRLDAWHGGFGVMGDDLVAGLYAGLAVRLAGWALPLIL
jgi:phosphatidylglycerophosphatase A